MSLLCHESSAQFLQELSIKMFSSLGVISINHPCVYKQRERGEWFCNFHIVFQFWTTRFLVQFSHYLCQFSTLSFQTLVISNNGSSTPPAEVLLIWSVSLGLTPWAWPWVCSREPVVKLITLCTDSFLLAPFLSLSLTSCSICWGSIAQ